MPFVTNCHRQALAQLRGAIKESQPIAVMIGRGNSGASYVISSFLADLGDDVDIARITGPCADATAGMRDVIRALGFDSASKSLVDLEGVLTMFLSYQRTHHRRTIICFEESQDSGWWVLDLIRKLVELETKGRFGLMVVVSGRPTLSQLLDEFPLNAICASITTRITLAPFSLKETAEYVRRRVGLAGTVDISQVFEFHAISLIHKLSEGVPDAVIRLCSRCLELKDEQGTATVTADMAKKAGISLEMKSELLKVDAEPARGEVSDMACLEGRIIARKNGELVHEQSVGRGHVLIGRDEACDVRLASKSVSRYHALIVSSPNKVRIIDLGSTNGILAKGRRVMQHTLKETDLVTVGDCTIEYFAGGDGKTLVFDTERTDAFESQIFHPEPPSSDYDQEEQSLDPGEETMTFSRHHTRR